MKWIKASERLPKYNTPQFLKVNIGGNNPIKKQGFLAVVGNKFITDSGGYDMQDVEWLDETASVEGESILKKRMKDFFENVDPDYLVKKFEEMGYKFVPSSSVETSLKSESTERDELIKRGLQDIDDELIYLEDFIHGEEGSRITQCRREIIDVIKLLSLESSNKKDEKDLVASDMNTDESSVASHSSTAGNSVEQSVEIFTRPECPFQYCDQEDGGVCKEVNKCHYT